MSCTYWSGPCQCVAECLQFGCRDTRPGAGNRLLGMAVQWARMLGDGARQDRKWTEMQAAAVAIDTALARVSPADEEWRLLGDVFARLPDGPLFGPQRLLKAGDIVRLGIEEQR